MSRTFLVGILIFCALLNFAIVILDRTGKRKIKVKRLDEETDEIYNKRAENAYKLNLIVGIINVAIIPILLLLL